MSESEQSSDAVPLCVDLDGTVLRTDLMWECITALLRRRPWCVLLLPVWWSRGRPYLKARLAREARPDLDCLPVRGRLIEWLRSQAKSGRQLLLVSGSHHWLVRRMARRFGFFSGAEGTRRGVNLSGGPKAEWLVARFGERGFDYAGDRGVDLRVWRRAREAILVDVPRRLEGAAREVALRVRVWDEAGRAGIGAWMQELRVRQWLKNLVVLAPAFTSYKFEETGVLLSCLVGAACFSLLASALYVFNDIVDLEFDRRHPDKCGRPLASGVLGMREALVAMPLLIAGAVAAAALLPAGFRWVLVAYGILSIFYTLALKRYVVVDALALTVMFLLRIVGGGWAAGIGVSNWLMGFALFLFLSLALAKRYAELRALREAQRDNAEGRGYRSADLEEVGFLGVASGLLSVFVVAIYIGSAEAAASYGNRTMLWALCLVIVFWVGRLWLINHRGELHEDPVRFVTHDPASYVSAAAAMAAIFLAR
ncbi:MAG TPA: UbiA family prenyltransferase [Verrucomicrobiae bacterium]|nr:UbiA family prenyltransferase [Verrucomicrobiae bacterium]